MTAAHPAKYSAAILPVLRDALRGYPLVLDPFAGTGRLREVAAVPAMIEIEPEWADLAGAVCGDCLKIMPTLWRLPVTVTGRTGKPALRSSR